MTPTEILIWVDMCPRHGVMDRVIRHSAQQLGRAFAAYQSHGHKTGKVLHYLLTPQVR